MLNREHIFTVLDRFTIFLKKSQKTFSTKKKTSRRKLQVTRVTFCAKVFLQKIRFSFSKLKFNFLATCTDGGLFVVYSDQSR